MGKGSMAAVGFAAGLFAGLMWGMWVGGRDERALIRAEREQAMHDCRAGILMTFHTSAGDQQSCVAGSNRWRKR
jgi:hypothetical protein